PGGDARVQHGVAQGEEQLRVVVEAVVPDAGHDLGDQRPVAGRELRLRAVGPVFGGDLLPVGEAAAVGAAGQGEQAVDVLGVEGAVRQLVGAGGRNRDR